MAPQSKEALLALPPDAVVDGKPVLVWAASWGDAAMVELLLQRGASALAIAETRESALRAAHRHPNVVSILRRAAREEIERTRSACASVVAMIFDRRYALARDRGAADLRAATSALDVLCVKADLKTAVKALATLVQAPRREADVAQRAVADAERLVFLYRLRGIDWTIVPFVFEPSSPWNVEHVTELAAPGTGIAPIARALANAVAARVVHVKHAEHTIYSEHGGIETRSGEDDLRALGILIPPMRATTDGFDVQLQLFGLEASDIERADVVVLRELGDPDVDRRVPQTSGIPAFVGPPPVASLPGAPPLVKQEEEERRPMQHEPPPMLAIPTSHAPPPMVPIAPAPIEPAMPEPPLSEPGRVSQPPAFVHAPPPMVKPKE